MNENTILHAMTIDVEDYYQVSAFAKVLSRDDWSSMESRVVNNTFRLLDFYDERNVKATFFILGLVANEHPEIVPEIVRRGHQIASHGYSHKLIYEQGEAAFREETERSRKLLQDQSGQIVDGYRAASYSITRKSLWALDILTENGFRWDSSIFPVYHDRYGIPDAPRRLHRAQTPNGADLIEIPLSTSLLGPLRMPIAGGGYFRIYPLWLTKWLWQKAIKETQSAQVFYLHPWEIDPQQPVIDGIGITTRLRHYLNLSRCESRLSSMIDRFQFGTIEEVLKSVDTTVLPSHTYTSETP